ncbi:MAG: hypothetical protein PVI94_04670 [Desulfobacterales bacterium]|jgi:hypothetical protein
MVFQVSQFWNLAGDGFQILLCLLMLGFFIKNRLTLKSALNAAKGATDQNFNTHIFSITVEQKLNQAFTNIIENISAERNGLECALGLNSLHHQDDDISMVRANTQLSDLNARQPLTDDRVGSSRRRDKIQKLAAKGLTDRQISEELKISISEVEIILSLSEK